MDPLLLGVCVLGEPRSESWKILAVANPHQQYPSCPRLRHEGEEAFWYKTSLL